MSGAVFRFAQIFIFLLPFQFALAPVAGIDLPFSRVFAIVLFLVWMAVSLARRNILIPSGPVAAGLLLFLSFSAFSIQSAEQPDWALRRISFLLSYLPLFPIFFSLIREYGHEGARKLLLSFVSGAVFAAAIGILQFFSQFFLGVAPVFRLWTDSILPFFLGPGFASAVSEYPSLLVNVGGVTILRASGFFPDPHVMGFYMGLAVPVAIVSFWSGKTPISGITGTIAAILLIIADLLTFSRGAYVGLFFGVVAAFFAFPSIGNGTRRRILPVMAVLSILLVSLSFDTPVRERALSIFSLEDGSNEGRMAMFVEAADRIMERPLGYGPGNYPLAVKPTAEYREPIYAHNLFLDIATEGGIVASIAFFLSVVAAFVLMIRCSSGNAIMRSGAVSLAVFFGHSLFETPLYSVHILPVLILFLALPAACARIKA